MSLRQWLCNLLRCCKETPPPPVHVEPLFQMGLTLDGKPVIQITLRGNIIMKICQPGQEVVGTVTPRGRVSGNPVAIDGPVQPTCDDDRVVASVDEDGLTVRFKLPADAVVTEPKAVTASVSFDAEEGDGVNTQTLVGSFMIGPEEAGANNSTFELADPVDSPAPQA